MGKVVAAALFWLHGGAWKNVAIFEGVSAVMMKLGMTWDSWCETRVRDGAAKGV